jgi:hypothetical protein
LVQANVGSLSGGNTGGMIHAVFGCLFLFAPVRLHRAQHISRAFVKS